MNNMAAKKMKKRTYFLFNEKMAAWLKNTRDSLQLMQSVASKEAGLTQTFLSRLERGAPKEIEQSKWAVIHDFYVSKGAKPIDAELDPRQSDPDPKALKREVLAIRKTSGASIPGVSKMLGVRQGIIFGLMAGRSLGPKSLHTLQKAIRALTKMPAQLHAEGLVSAPKEGKTKKAAKVKAKPSLITQHVEIPTEAAIAMRELEALSVLKKYLPTHGNFMNGTAARVARG